MSTDVALSAGVWTELPITKAAVIRHKSGKDRIVYAQYPSLASEPVLSTAIFDDSVISEKVYIDGVIDNHKIYALALNHDCVISVTQRSSSGLPDGVFEGTRAITAQGYIEANTKNGLQFSAASLFTGITANQNLDVIFITGDKPVIIKAQYIATKNAGDVIADFYENPTYTGGANLNSGIFNQTRISPQPTTVNLVGLAPTDPLTYNLTPNLATAPNVTDVGLKIQPPLFVLGVTGAGNSSTAKAAESGLDTVLKPNTVYLYRRHCVGAVASFFGFTTWYEGDPDLPI